MIHFILDDGAGLCAVTHSLSARVVLLLPGTLDTDISFGHCDPTKKNAHVLIKLWFFRNIMAVFKRKHFI